MILALYLLMLGHLRHGACLDRHCGPNSVAICTWCSCPEGASLIKASFLGRRRFNCPLGAGPHLFLLAICFSQKRCSLITFFGLCPSYCIAVVRPMSIFFFLFQSNFLRDSHVACRNNRGDFKYCKINCFHMIQIQADLQAC